MFITTQDIVNFRNPTAEVLPVEKDFSEKSKYTVKINLMHLNFCSPTMPSFNPCLAEICKLKSVMFQMGYLIFPSTWMVEGNFGCLMNNDLGSHIDPIWKAISSVIQDSVKRKDV